MSEHTPGPWTVEVLPPTIRVVSQSEQESDGRSYGDDIALIGECRNETHQANARLISAAPELLDVLKRIVNVAKMGRYRDKTQLSLGATPVIEDAESAIAKAQGTEASMGNVLYENYERASLASSVLASVLARGGAVATYLTYRMGWLG